jgi:putative hydrolase of the HAD superfamily
MRRPSTPPTLPRAILLDLDDTIIDFGGSAECAWAAVCEAAAQEVDGLDAQVLLEAITGQRQWYWSDPDRHREGRADLRAASRRIVDAAFRSIGHELPQLAAIVANTYRDIRWDAIRPFPGALEALERMRGLGIRLGLVTNGSAGDQRAKIERFDLARHFAYILIEGEFGCGKPDQRVYEAAMHALGSEPATTWCVGDNLEWEVAAPQRLGVYSVWLDAAGTGLPADTAVRPDRIIRALTELV